MNQSQDELKKLYQQIKKGEISKQDALEKIRMLQSNLPADSVNQKKISNDSDAELLERLMAYFKNKLALILKIDLSKIKNDTVLENYGLDSVTIMQLTAELENDFGPLSKTLFFEFQTLEALADYFMMKFASKVQSIMGVSTERSTPDHQQPVTKNEPSPQRSEQKVYASSVNGTEKKKEQNRPEMAIIGLAGRYPKIDSMNDFWTTIKEGKSVITKVPKDRWDEHVFQIQNDDGTESTATQNNFGGFMNGVDKFDCSFFNILPQEAKYMDPQERLFLECVYNVLEDAGYTPKTLTGSSEPAKVGVFVGVTFEEYQLYAAQETLLGRTYSLPGVTSAIANRVSYYFNFDGPSLAVDTMCSASSTAVHMACKSIENGDCDTAIAGGVNVTIHPNKYILLSQGKFLSKAGACASFGEGGDGYVPSEGVGAILIKEKNKAIADGDHIYGIIKSTSINHGGKSKNFSVPNPVAQSKVIRAAMEKAGVNPRAVSYIEAHGTGTSLGDPIEISGLEKVFSPYSDDKQYCAIGSIKSNIGHCESAAGIAGITKVLLQLKYKTLVPSIHSKILNKNIDFENSPFKVQQQLEQWKTPLLDLDGKGQKNYPRIAGISSFGAGGANAHIIIEEYDEQIDLEENNHPQVVLLSAKSDKQLDTQVQNILNFLDEEPIADKTLSRIAATLQIGREHHDKRVAFIVKDKDQLRTTLQKYLNNDPSQNAFKGEVQKKQDLTSRFSSGGELNTQIENWIRERKIEKIVDLWRNGIAIDWTLLYDGKIPKKIALPTYPFDRQKYWMPELDFTQHGVSSKENRSIHLHPLLHINTSTLKQQQFTSTFSGNELLFAHHQVNGNKTLPGVAYLEMLRKAMELSAEVSEQEMKIQNLIWLQPFIVNAERTLHLRLLPVDNFRIKFEFYGTHENREQLFCIGEVLISNLVTLDFPRLRDIQASVIREVMTAAELYALYKKIGLNYGGFNQGIDKIMSGENNALARLVLSTDAQTGASLYAWHPGLLDPALQACIGTKLGQRSNVAEQEILLPFGIDEVKALKPLSNVAWVYVETISVGQNDLQKQNIYLYDNEGNPCFYFKGFSLRSLNKQTNQATTQNEENKVVSKSMENTGELCLKPVWSVLANELPDNRQFAKHTIMYAPQFEENIEKITASLGLFRLIPLKSSGQNDAEKFIDYSTQVFEEIRSLFNHREEQLCLQVIVPLGSAFEGISGALKTAMQENTNFKGQLIAIDHSKNLAEAIVQSISYPLLKSENGILYKEELKEITDLLNDETTVFRNQGVYLITGGAGGLGAIFADAIASGTSNSTIILTGRSPETSKIKTLIASLVTKGAHASYQPVDINDLTAVHQLIYSVLQKHQKINGIIHSAGILKDNYILRKKKEEFKDVLRPKIIGTYNIDEATKNVKLDWMVLFSSVSGAFGNAGQVDYSTGNAFMDYFAQYREQLTQKGERNGKTRSINWPLWKDGGMKIDADQEKIIAIKTGMKALPSDVGELLFTKILQHNSARVISLYGNTYAIVEKLGLTSEQKTNAKMESIGGKIGQPDKNDDRDPVNDQDQLQLEKRSLEFIQNQIGEFLELRTSPDMDANFETFGIDSVLLIQLTSKLESVFGPLPKTLFFEYQNIRQLTQFFIKEYAVQLNAIFGLTAQAAGQTEEGASHVISDRKQGLPFRSLSTNGIDPGTTIHKQTVQANPPVQEAVAIIAIAGKYPGAKDINEFWENLKQKKISITEVPEHRWERDPGNFQLGGFIDNIDQFDALFFNVSDRDAEIMDPQEKLFLENTWYLLENGAYSAARIEEVTKNKVGVFVGVMSNQYPLIKSPEEKLNSLRNLSSFHSIANRTSYYFNLNGPSLAVDSASSSGLTSVHLACKSILNEECKMAIAGGINLSIHPSKYEALTLLGMLGTHEDCRSFGEGNGYLPSEGVGALLLKKLSDAEKDGDTILAVIKSTSINHIGRSTGYSVQSPNLQAQLIIENFERANIDPRTISYAELAANGSLLGDALELVGINKAFRKFTNDKEFCAIGSVKSNLGHGEAVSGIAQITKVVLQLQHKQLVPNVPVTKKNPNISFADSPFFIQDQLQEWKVIPSADGDYLPRRATVNSLGATGSNGHMILEEYISEKAFTETRSSEPQIIVLSARTWTDLKSISVRLVNYIVENKDTLRLESVAKTLQLGRTAMNCRMSFVADTLDEVVEGLRKFNESDNRDSFSYQGRMMNLNQGNQDKNEIQQLLKGAEGEIYMEALLANKNHEKLAVIWTQGGFDQWKNNSHENNVPYAILPNYPFNFKSHWIDGPVKLKPLNNIIESKNITLPNEIGFIENRSSTKKEIALKPMPQKRKKKDLN